MGDSSEAPTPPATPAAAASAGRPPPDGDESLLSTLSRDWDWAAVDLGVSLFAAALFSYRHETLLRPFPPAFVTDPADPEETKDVEAVRAAIAALPVPVAAAKPAWAALAGQPRLPALLTWILQPRGQRIHTLSVAMYDTLQNKTGSAAYSVRPDHVFEIQHTGPAGAAFDRLAEQHGMMLAYHGTAIENAYSIVRNGFCSHMNKTSLYGEGTYLSSDLTVAMSFSRSGRAWDKSRLGHNLSVVLVCEVVKHPDVQLQGAEIGRFENTKSLGGDKVPNKYVVVPNNDHVRPRYLLVYAESKPAPLVVDAARSPLAVGAGLPPPPQQPGWLARNRFLATMLCYALVLLVIGLFQNRTARRALRRLFT